MITLEIQCAVTYVDIKCHGPIIPINWYLVGCFLSTMKTLPLWIAVTLHRSHGTIFRLVSCTLLLHTHYWRVQLRVSYRWWCKFLSSWLFTQAAETCWMNTATRWQSLGLESRVSLFFQKLRFPQRRLNWSWIIFHVYNEILASVIGNVYPNYDKWGPSKRSLQLY